MSIAFTLFDFGEIKISIDKSPEYSEVGFYSGVYSGIWAWGFCLSWSFLSY